MRLLWCILFLTARIHCGTGRQTQRETPERKVTDSLQREFGILAAPLFIKLRSGSCWPLLKQADPSCRLEKRLKVDFLGMQPGDILGLVYLIHL